MRIIILLSLVILTGCGFKSKDIYIGNKTYLECNLGKGTLLDNFNHARTDDKTFYAAINISCVVKDSTDLHK